MELACSGEGTRRIMQRDSSGWGGSFTKEVTFEEVSLASNMVLKPPKTRVRPLELSGDRHI